MKKLALSLMACAMILSCQKETKTETVETTAPEVTTVETTTEDVANVSNTVTIEGHDNMTFNLKEIRVKAGEPVTLTLKHVGSLPEASMGHNWVLLKPGTDVADFAVEAMNFKDNNYVPSETDKVIAHTEVIGGGEETTITFDAPEAGTYDFICSFPGHYGSMKGQLIVE